MIDAATTLGDVVTSTPALASYLERRGRDYCCGGDRTLADAFTDRGLDLDATIDELRAAAVTTAGESPAWATMVVGELVDHLEASFHRYLWVDLPRLSALVEKIVAVHGERHREVPAVADRLAELRSDLEPHLLDEERGVFPAIRQIVTSDDAPRYDTGPSAGGSLRCWPSMTGSASCWRCCVS